MADPDSDLDRRIAAFLAAPAGCAFLLVVEESDLDPAVAARPEIAVHVAAVALSAIDRWQTDHPWAPTTALSHGPRLEPLARAILACPETAAWSAPLDRRAQVWTSWGVADPPFAHRASPPTEPFAYWESLDGPSGGRELWTSTAVGDTTSFLAGLEYGAGDLYADGWPINLYRLDIPPSARVLEIGGPEDWRRLCDRYPGHVNEDGQLFPDLAAVANDWDGVHLSLWAVLTAEQVRVDGPGGWTEIETVEAEHTAWLRWVFDGVDHVDNLWEPPPSPVDVRHPHALWNTGPDAGWVSLQPGPVEAPPPRPPVATVTVRGGGDGADDGDVVHPGVLLLANWVVDGQPLRADELAAFAWPPAIPIPPGPITVDLGSDVAPTWLDVRVFRELDPNGIPRPTPADLDLRCRSDAPAEPCRLRRATDGRWSIELDLPDGPDDLHLAVLALWSAPDARAAASGYDLSHFNATWLFTLRLENGRADAG